MKMSELSVCVIGAGRVGSALALSLSKAGFNRIEIFDLDYKKSESVSKASSGRIFSLKNLNEVSKRTKLLFFCVPDDSIFKAAESFLSSNIFDKNGLAVHTSGLYASSILKAFSEQGISTASFHPCASFTQENPPSFKHIPVAIEGDENAVNLLFSLVRDSLDGRPFKLTLKQKTAYHTACVIASNYLVVLMHSASEILQSANVNQNSDFLIPLLKQTLENIRLNGDLKALTGPVLRGDCETVRQHLDLLDNNHTIIAEIYRACGKMAVKMTEKRGADAEKQKCIDDLFNV